MNMFICNEAFICLGLTCLLSDFPMWILVKSRWFSFAFRLLHINIILFLNWIKSRLYTWNSNELSCLLYLYCVSNPSRSWFFLHRLQLESICVRTYAHTRTHTHRPRLLFNCLLDKNHNERKIKSVSFKWMLLNTYNECMRTINRVYTAAYYGRLVSHHLFSILSSIAAAAADVIADSLLYMLHIPNIYNSVV